MLYVSILQSLGVHPHCAGVCLHPVRVHACNALSNNFSSWLSLLSSGFEFHFAELSFLSSEFFFFPLKHVTQREGCLPIHSAVWETVQSFGCSVGRVQ